MCKSVYRRSAHNADTRTMLVQLSTEGRQCSLMHAGRCLLILSTQSLAPAHTRNVMQRLQL